METRKIPSDVMSEKAVLGCCMLSKQSAVIACKMLTEECFHEQNNRYIFSIIKNLLNSGNSIDLTSVLSKISPDKINGDHMGVLLEITKSVGSSASIKTYCNNVLTKWESRNAIDVGSRIMEMGFNDEEDLPNKLKEMVISVSGKQSNEELTLKDGLKELRETQKQFAIRLLEGKSILGMTTGINSLDKMIDGVLPKMLYTFSGYTSSGKTQLTLNIMNSLLKQDARIMYFSLEMAPDTVLNRLAGIRTGMDMKSIKHNYNSKTNTPLSDSDIELMNTALEEIADSDITISMNSDWNSIRSKLLEIEILKNKDFIFIDYIQHISGKGFSSRNEMMTQIAIALHEFAIKTGVSVFIVSQISKEDQINKFDDVISVKDSSSIAEKSDFIFLMRPDKDLKKDDIDLMKANGEPIPVTLNLQKGRHGVTGKSRVLFETNTGRIYDNNNSFDDIN